MRQRCELLLISLAGLAEACFKLGSFDGTALPSATQSLVACREAPTRMPLGRRRRRRMVGAWETGIERMPWLVRMEFMGGRVFGRTFIANGGVLIAPNLVLTAMHPLLYIKSMSKELLSNLQLSTRIHAGSNRRWALEWGGTSRGISKVFYHPSTDLVIIKTVMSFGCALSAQSRQQRVAIAPLSRHPMAALTDCISGGWGKDDTNVCHAELRVGAFRTFNGDGRATNGTIFATGLDGAVGNSIGDSGAPLMCMSVVSGKREVAGILSSLYLGVDGRIVSQYIDTRRHIPWIEGIMNEHQDNFSKGWMARHCAGP